VLVVDAVRMAVGKLFQIRGAVELHACARSKHECGFTPTSVIDVNLNRRRNSTQLNCGDCGWPCNDAIRRIVMLRCCAQITRCLLAWLSSWVALSFPLHSHLQLSWFALCRSHRCELLLKCWMQFWGTFSSELFVSVIVDSACFKKLFWHVSSIEGDIVPKEGDEVTFKRCLMPPKNEKYAAVHVHIAHQAPVAHEKWDKDAIERPICSASDLHWLIALDTRSVAIARLTCVCNHRLWSPLCITSAYLWRNECLNVDLDQFVVFDCQLVLFDQ